MLILNTVSLIMIMGLMLVPSLLLEEKQTKTMDALLISPANIAQVVIGKALVLVVAVPNGVRATSAPSR